VSLSLSLRVVLVLGAALLARPGQTQEPVGGQSLIVRAIFAEEHSWPAGIIRLVNGSFVVQRHPSEAASRGVQLSARQNERGRTLRAHDPIS